MLHYRGISNYNDLTIQAAFTLAFASFLSISEFTYKAIDIQMGPSFQNWFLTKSCIWFIKNSKHMQLTLPASKTDLFRQVIQLIMAGSHDNACPVQAIKQPIARDKHRPPQAPLSCVGRIAQQLFTLEYVVQKLQTVGTSSGFVVGSWNGDSLCLGAATWAAEW